MAAKYQFIADQLRIQIKAGKYASASVLPTEFALCQEYQVSRQTVRQALALLVQEGLIEKRQGSGSTIVRESQTHSQRTAVAVITTYISDYIFPSILREIERVFSENGCSPMLFATRNQVDNERRILTDLLETNLDGIIVEGSKSVLPNPNFDLYQRLADRNIPIVFIHSTYSNLQHFPSVTDDNQAGSRMLVEYLYRKGHRDIAGIFKSDDAQGLLRYQGYMEALRKLGAPMDDRRVFWYDTALKEKFLHDEAIAQAFPILEGCTAVVCYNDEVADSLIRYLIKQGVDVPGQMAVVSFDNSQYSYLSPVPITSLSHGEQNVGRLAAEMLLRLMRGEYCRPEKAPWTLVEKQSS